MSETERERVEKALCEVCKTEDPGAVAVMMCDDCFDRLVPTDAAPTEREGERLAIALNRLAKAVEDRHAGSFGMVTPKGRDTRLDWDGEAGLYTADIREAAARLEGGEVTGATYTEDGRRYCHTCGTEVEVVSSDEGTSYYRPVGERPSDESAGEDWTDEDLARQLNAVAHDLDGGAVPLDEASVWLREAARRLEGMEVVARVSGIAYKFGVGPDRWRWVHRNRRRGDEHPAELIVYRHPTDTEEKT